MMSVLSFPALVQVVRSLWWFQYTAEDGQVQNRIFERKSGEMGGG